MRFQRAFPATETGACSPSDLRSRDEGRQDKCFIAQPLQNCHLTLTKKFALLLSGFVFPALDQGIHVLYRKSQQFNNRLVDLCKALHFVGHGRTEVPDFWY